MSCCLDPATVLSDELMILILKDFDQKNLGRFCQVSKNWNRLSSCNDLWKRFAKAEFINEICIKDRLSPLYSKQVDANDEIMDKFQRFLNRCSIFSRENRFKCIFGKAKYISVEIINEHGPIGSVFSENLDVNDPGDQIMPRFTCPDFESKGMKWKDFTRTTDAELDFSDPANPIRISYNKISGLFGAFFFKIYVPQQAPSPLLERIVYMTAVKCKKFRNQENLYNNLVRIGVVAFTLKLCLKEY